MPLLYVIAGPNGAGKTTAFNSLIPVGLDYINADLVAKSIREQAGGLNVQEIANNEVSKAFFSKIEKKESFAIETNLCDLETYKTLIGVQRLGYEINIFFISVDDVDICINRVKSRVKEGGHHVNPDVIQNRYITGLKLLNHYKNFPDCLALLDNSFGTLSRQAELHKGQIHFQDKQIAKWIINTGLLEMTSPKKELPDSIEEIKKHYANTIQNQGLSR